MIKNRPCPPQSFAEGRGASLRARRSCRRPHADRQEYHAGMVVVLGDRDLFPPRACKLDATYELNGHLQKMSAAREVYMRVGLIRAVGTTPSRAGPNIRSWRAKGCSPKSRCRVASKREQCAFKGEQCCASKGEHSQPCGPGGGRGAVAQADDRPAGPAPRARPGRSTPPSSRP